MNFDKHISCEDFQYLKMFVNESPEKWFRNIYLYITEKCQLNCKHCYLGDEYKKGRELSKEKIFENLKLWRELGGEKICFLGGEPTLHPDFVEIIKFSNELKYKIITYDTNCLDVSYEKTSSLSPSQLSYLQVSLDGGTKMSNDLIRGNGVFNIVLKNIKKLCKKGFDVRIICTVNKENIADCLNVLNIANDIGVGVVKYHIFSGIGSGKFNRDLAMKPSEWLEFCKVLRNKKKEFRSIKIQYQPSYGNEETKKIYRKNGYNGCLGRSLNRMSILPDGKVFICSFLFNTDLYFAKIIDNQLKIKKDTNELKLFYEKNMRCGSCSFDEFCSNGCVAEQINDEQSCGNDKNIYPICRLWKNEA